MPVSLPPEPVVTQEVRIVDQQGRPRIVLSASNGVPTLVLLSESGTVGATVALDAAGRPSVTLANPNPAWPTAALAVDDKGAHVKFDRPGGASSYLFLNNAGGSGVVLVDNAGRRRLNATVAADGTANVEPLSVDGKAPQ
ncbi:hypothetical protein [Paraburkholderia dilworthii]|uniref:Lactonase, 7-bladed beta-propeller n=1 Tax=Paraburkholderia dilworthii TaxID=948106 RepID=A0ABW9D3W6_9BURK